MVLASQPCPCEAPALVAFWDSSGLGQTRMNFPSLMVPPRADHETAPLGLIPKYTARVNFSFVVNFGETFGEPAV